MMLADSSTEECAISIPSRPAMIHEDTLAEIFSHLSRDSDRIRNEGRDWDWTSILCVCRQWHAVATGTPRLWSYIDTFQSTDRTRKFIQLSKEADLTIIYTVENPEKDNFHYLNLILQEMRRIVYLSLLNFSREAMAFLNNRELLDLLSQPAPRMKKLNFADINLQQMPLVQLPSTSVGVLREVTLSTLKLSAVVQSITCVSSLKLWGCTFSLSELLDFLKTCVTLRSLLLGFCRIDFSTSPTLKSIQAKNLTRLTMLSNTPSKFLNLLEKIDAPNFLRTLIHCKSNMKNIDGLDETLKTLKRNYDAKKMTLLTGYRRHSSILTGTGFVINVDVCVDKTQEEARLTLSFSEDVDMNSVLHCYTRMLHSYLTTTPLLQISANDRFISKEAWRSLFIACTSTKAAYIGLGKPGGESCLAALALVDRASAPPPREAQTIPIPNLEHLTIRWKGVLRDYPHKGWDASDLSPLFESLEEVLKSRFANGFRMRKVTICSDWIRDDDMSRALKPWVEELEFRGLDECCVV